MSALPRADSSAFASVSVTGREWTLKAPGGIVRLALRVRSREFHRAVREASISLAPRWLDDVAWTFPTWRLTRRPFDWAVDEADVPVAPEDRWHRGDRQQFDFYLRPAPAAVQR